MIIKVIASFVSLVMLLLGITSVPATDTEAKINGSFIQSWYAAYGDDEFWNDELTCLREAGVEYLVLQDVASYSEDGVSAYYPSEYADPDCPLDVIDDVLSHCSEYGIKVFIGCADFEEWWTYGGFSSRYDDVCRLTSGMFAEIYENYKDRYGDTLFGWYFTPEISNNPVMQLSLCEIVKGLNGIIDTINALDPSMPLLLSPYFTEYYAVPTVTSAISEWVCFVNSVNFRDGDIICPQDAVGAGWTSEKNLGKVWKMYRTAVDSCDRDLKLWANCENFILAREGGFGNPPATLETEDVPCAVDRFVRQLDAAAKYADNIICFSYSHYYSVMTGNRAYHDAYMYYLENGETDSDAPSQPGGVVLSDGVLTWDAAEDNTGTAYYIIYNDGKAIARTEADEPLSYRVSGSGNYFVKAVDGSGNISE